jgi:type I restriction enzyme S subunit
VVVPADWKEVRLGEHAAFFKGNGLSKSQLIDDGPQQCVHYGELFTHYGPVIENVTNKCVAFEGSFKSLAGDVLMPGSDVTPRGLATASAIKVSDVVLGGDVIVIRTKPTSLYGPFLSNFIRMSKGRVLRLVKGSTVYHIHAKDLADLEVLMPPLKEQEAIADALSDADVAIESLDALVAKKRDLKQATMQQLLTGRTRLPGFTADWNEVRLGSFISLRTGKLDVNAGSPDGVFPFFTCSQETLRINHAEFSGKSVIVAGNGDLGVKFFDGEFNAYQRTYILQSLDERNLDVSFLYAYMLRYVESLRKATQGSTIQYLKKQQFTEARLPLPVLGEQQAIAEALTVMDDELGALTAQVSKLRMVKEGMMQDLLTGKVRLV